MRVILLCATRRGRDFLGKLSDLLPDAELAVFSFREEPGEPPFLDDIRRLAHSRRAEYFEAADVGRPELKGFWESTPGDLMLVVSWRRMIPARLYNRPRLGTYVFHDSLLPRYRGFSPTVWAIANGEDHTGVTLFRIADEADAGDIVDQQKVPIGPDDTIGIVRDRVTRAYLEILERNLPALLRGNAPARPQDPARATTAPRRTPEDNRIDWSAPADCTHNLIRAVTHPYPGAFTTLEGRTLRIWAAKPWGGRPFPDRALPGEVFEVQTGAGVGVRTGDGALFVTEVQREGDSTACAADILNRAGARLGS